MWWRKFVQYINMNKVLDLSKMTNYREILPQYRDQLETDIKDIFLWAIGQNAITEKTKTIREREPSSPPLYKLYTLFRLHFTSERNVQHSRAHLLTSNGRTESQRLLESTNTRSQEKLRIRNNNHGRTPSIDILIRYQEIDGKLSGNQEIRK